MSNVDLTAYSAAECRFVFDEEVFPGRGSSVELALRLRKRDIDAILVFHDDAKTLLALTFYKAIGGRAAIFLFDLLLARPASHVERVRALAKAVLLRCANKYICVHKDTSAYERYYGLPKRKIVYVPFKANCFETRDRYSIEEGDYVLSCGTSYRDYDTLIEAVRGLKTAVKIVLPAEDVARYHNTRASLLDPPANVEIVRHDFNRDTWYTLLAKAKLVVVPILKYAIQPAGISVYLEAMSMGKAVIVSDSPSTRGILDSTMAYLVPVGDPVALRSAIRELCADDNARRRLAASGQRYADSLRGVRRLVADLARVVCDSLSGSTR